MAVADTANLIVSLKLDDRFSGPLRGINRQLDTFTRNASLRGGLGQIGQGLGKGVRNAALLAAPAVAGLAVQIRAGVDSLRELERVEAQTNAVIESTGGAAGISAKQIRDLAEEYETLGGIIDDKVIQAGANVLLTFTDIRKEAFEPALEAALDLSTALDQDLQTSVIQIGKALQDPVRGITALRRAGVNFTKEQEQQIRDLVDAGREVEAQQIILTELNKEFGGSFEAAGQTSEATIARFGDSIEGLQQNLATAFLPAIDKVARRLTEIFADPTTQAAVKDFGERLAGFLNEENLGKAESAVRGVFDYLAAIPWGAIGDGLRIAGEAAKVAVDAFRSLPPGVQNALITLLAANKLTGGLVASGLGQLAGLALSQLKTITAGNVTVIGANVTGGGVPGAAGKGGPGPLGQVALGATAIGGGALLGSAIGNPLFEAAVAPARDFMAGVVDKIASSDDTERIREAISQLDSNLDAWTTKPPQLQQIMQPTIDQIAAQRAELQARLDALLASSATASSMAAAWNAEQRTAYANLYSSSERQNSKADALASLAKSANDFGSRTAAATEATSRKNFSPLVKVDNNISIPVSVSARVIAERVYEQTLTTNGRLDETSVF